MNSPYIMTTGQRLFWKAMCIVGSSAVPWFWDQGFHKMAAMLACGILGTVIEVTTPAYVERIESIRAGNPEEAKTK